MNAPILLVGFNRPEHLKRAISSLAANVEASQSELFIAIDGPRFESEVSLVLATRDVAKSASGFSKIHLLFSEKNLGLSESVSKNISYVLSKHLAIIVVEDDLQVSEHFLNYINCGLDKYQSVQRVASIHGYQYPIGNVGDVCGFLRGADCWGWGTWKDRWESVNFDSESVLSELKSQKLLWKFNYFGLVNNSRMLNQQIAGEIDSWAIRWHASMFLQNRLTLFPPRSLVLNKGLDGSGTHEGESKIFNTQLATDSDWVFPSQVKQSQRFRTALLFYYFHVKVSAFLVRFSKLIKWILGRLK
jgi:hypothetical protein